jgi:hypothetical protein
MQVHIEGMGVQGSLLAHRLHMRGIDFTWNDIEVERVAWQASTGAIYPSGSTTFGPDEECREQWLEWFSQGFLGGRAGGLLELADWVYCTKVQPHGGKYIYWDIFDGDLRMASPFALHLNAQQLVKATRERFAERRLELPPPPGQLDWHIVSHGWGKRLSHVYWGWTRLVRLEYEHTDKFVHLRPAFYFREGRFIMAYAYPVPGTPYWYAGSNIIKQRPDARLSLEMPSKYERWRSNFERLGGGHVRVVEEGDFLEGWRPAADQRDTAWVKVSYQDRVAGRGQMVLRPCWNNGIRHFPYQWYQVAKMMRIEP